MVRKFFRPEEMENYKLALNCTMFAANSHVLRTAEQREKYIDESLAAITNINWDEMWKSSNDLQRKEIIGKDRQIFPFCA